MNYKANRVYKKTSITLEGCERYGLNYLAKFSTSEELFKRFIIEKAKKKHIVDNYEQLITDVDLVANKLKRLGYLGDKSYCSGRVKSLLKQGFSIYQIKAKLTQKMVTQDIIKNYFNNFNNEQIQDLEQYSILKYIYKRRFFDWQEFVGIENKKIASIARRGFDYDLTINSLNNISSKQEYDKTLGSLELKYDL